MVTVPIPREFQEQRIRLRRQRSSRVCGRLPDHATQFRVLSEYIFPCRPIRYGPASASGVRRQHGRNFADASSVKGFRGAKIGDENEKRSAKQVMRYARNIEFHVKKPGLFNRRQTESNGYDLAATF